MIERKIRIGNLFDFYGELLTDNQKEVIKLYILEDLTLGEISQQLEVSRQAVYDAIRRSEHLLSEYESKLGLIEKFQQHATELQEIKEELDEVEKSVDNEHTKEIIKDIALKIDELIY